MARWEKRTERVSACPAKTPGIQPMEGTSCSTIGDRYNTGICMYDGLGGLDTVHTYMVCVAGTPTVPDPTLPTSPGKIKIDGEFIEPLPGYTSSKTTDIYGRIKNTPSVVNNYWILLGDSFSFTENPEVHPMTNIRLHKNSRIQFASFFPRNEMVAPVAQITVTSGTRTISTSSSSTHGNKRKIILLQGGGGGGGNSGQRGFGVTVGGGGYDI